jgi:hypothetical protein
MTDRTLVIDYEALAKAADEAYDETERDWSDDVPYTPRAAYAARAVVAAYVAQQRARGVVEVGKDTLGCADRWYAFVESDYPSSFLAEPDELAIAEIRAALYDSAPQIASSDKLAT